MTSNTSNSFADPTISIALNQTPRTLISLIRIIVTRYTGLELRIVSTYAKELGGLNWRQVDHVIEGLQIALYLDQIFTEAKFLIYDGLTAKKLQGKGSLLVVQAPAATS